MLRLYYMPGTVALASHIALVDAGAGYEIEKVDFAVSQQTSADYLKLNPKGRVPALRTPHGTLSETPAILAFIAQTHPHAALAPVDPFELARCQAFDSYFCSTVHIAHAHRMTGVRRALLGHGQADLPGSAGKSCTTTSSVTVSSTAQLNCPALRGSRPSPAEPGLTTSTRPTRRTTCRCVWP